MSGVIASLAAYSGVYSVSIADYQVVTTQLYGFDSVLAQGAIAPASFRGSSILVAVTVTTDAPRDFAITIDGNALGQSYFTSIQVVDTAGTVRTLTSASATYSTSGLDSSWQWGNGSNPVWTAAGARIMRIIQ